MTLPDPARWTRLSPLLDELLELDATARTQRLNALRGHDPDLARELESLLGASTSAQAAQFLSTRDHLPETEASDLIGKQIGAYVIESRLGEGATGSVWAASRSDGRFEGRVAIKLLHLSLIGRSGAQRFEREAAILARLAHPNIARLLDAGVTPEGQPYLVLELVEGQRIDLHCDEKRLGIEQRLSLFNHVLAATAHAHNHLVVHRDIKPGNIFVTPSGQVKLLDFGIAKLLQEDNETTSITVDGQRVMTPQYAAPEQLQGGTITTATDVYALGVLLFRLLAGGHPTSTDKASSAEVIRSTLESEPARLSSVLGRRGRDDQASQIAFARNTTPSRLQRDLRGDLDNIANQALRKDPSERYQTVAALAEDLRRFMAHEPVDARPDSLAYRGTKFVRRNRGAVAAGMLVLTSIAVGLAGTIWQAQKAEVAAQQATQERDKALRQLGYAESSSEFISFLLQEGADRPFTTPELLDRGKQLVDHQFSDDPAQRAHLQLMLAQLYGQATKPKEAEALLQRARTAAGTTSDLALQFDIECELATQYSDNGSIDQGRRIFDAAMARLAVTPVGDRAVLARCLYGRSQLVAFGGHAQQALDDIQAALSALGPPRPDQRSLAIQMHAKLAMAQNRLGLSAAGAQEMRRAVADLQSMGRGRTTLSRALQNDLGSLLARSGQTREAAEAYEKALSAAPSLAPNPALEANYARLLVELGRPLDAKPLIEHATAENEQRGSPRRAAMIPLAGALAWCDTLDFARCDTMLEAARSGLNKASMGQSNFAILEMRQGQSAMAQGALQAARSHLRQALAIYDAIPEPDPYVIQTRTLLSRVELKLGDLGAAQDLAALAVKQARDTKSGFEHSAWLGRALVAFGLAQQASGQIAQARNSWQEAVIELNATMGESTPASQEVRRLLAEF